jgi:hypothetical protein
MAKMEQRYVTVWCVAVLLLVGVGAALAADLPKQGSYDITSCWSGVSSAIAFSKTHNAWSVENTGTTRSNPPGGAFDMITFRCVGMFSSIEGKNTGMNLCEAIDKDGDKYLTRNSVEGPKTVQETLAGTGKYEGMVRTATAESLGQFPTIKPGTFQGCNRATGTYKLK